MHAVEFSGGVRQKLAKKGVRWPKRCASHNTAVELLGVCTPHIIIGQKRGL